MADTADDTGAVAMPDPTGTRSWSLAWVAVAIAAVAFAASLGLWLSGGAAVDVPWAPTMGVRLELAFDGLGALYALLATGVGLLVFLYGVGYLPLHLHHDHRPASEGRRFWPWMVLFMGAMVGLACARDLVLMFLFFDLTAVASYFLIGFDRDRREARGAALMSLLVTGISAIAMLIGAVLLYTEYGTYSVPLLIERAEPGTLTTVATVLIAVAALAKSAQVPLHFWLPRAMEAPTPVSAYLHSAAMVAAGVLVLGRIHPLLALDPGVLDGLLIVGIASIVAGGLLALAQDRLKQVLAYSTISQYGYVVVLYGIGGEVAAGAAALYVIAHGIAKSALFLTAGAVIMSTGEDRLSHLGGLARSMPGVALASFVATAALAAFPLTIGFFKDELFFAAALERGPLIGLMAVVAAALTVAYIWRFWLGVFAGQRRSESTRVPLILVAPIGVLAIAAVVGGVVVEPFAQLAADAAAVTFGAPVHVDPAYHLDTRPENVMALSAWALGGLVLVASPIRVPVVRTVARLGELVGPRRWYGLLLGGIGRLSDRVHRSEVRDLRTSLAAVLLPTGLLVALGFLATPTEGSFIVGQVTLGDLPILVLLALAVAAAITVARDVGRLRPILALSVLGFALAAVYAAMGAPDVALVAVVVETMVTVVFVGVFSRLPAAAPRPPGRRLRDMAAGVVAGVSALAVIWAVLSSTSTGGGDSAEHIRLAPSAHGSDVVTVILADFRGLDTMVEITVLLTGVVGIASLLRRGRSW